MNCIFNDLSFAPHVDTEQKLLPALEGLQAFHDMGHDYGHLIFIHRDALYASKICGLGFRQAVNHHMQNPDDKRRLLRLLDKSTPALPEDTLIPSGCCFTHNGGEIPCSGLAECAYRLHMEDASHAFSLACTAYAGTPLSVTIASGEDMAVQDVPNSTGLAMFRSDLNTMEPEIQSWVELLQRALRLSLVRIEDSARESLNRETFEVSLGRLVWERLLTVQQMASSTGSEYNRLIKEYCHHKSAMFSLESDTRCRELKEKLSFWINGEKKLCSFHGKIRHRDFRIHMDKQPAPGGVVHIAYIGYKIL